MPRYFFPYFTDYRNCLRDNIKLFNEINVNRNV